MDSKSRVMILVAIFICFFMHSPSQTYAHNVQKFPSAVTKHVLNVCKKGKFGFCARSLLSNSMTVSATDLKSVAEAALNNAKKESMKVRDFFLHLVKNNLPFKKVIQSCADDFDLTIKQFSNIGYEGGTASYDVHRALDTLDTCERALADAKVHIKSIATTIQQWRKYYDVAYQAVVAAEDSVQ